MKDLIDFVCEIADGVEHEALSDVEQRAMDLADKYRREGSREEWTPTLRGWVVLVRWDKKCFWVHRGCHGSLPNRVEARSYARRVRDLNPDISTKVVRARVEVDEPNVVTGVR